MLLVYITIVSHEASRTRRMSELFTRSTALKIVNALAKAP